MRKKSGREPGRESVEEPGEVAGEVEVSDQQVEMYERIQFLKEKFGDDATGRASIQRRLKDGRLIGLPSIPALTFDTDLVAKRYGGGRYYVRFYQGRQYLGDIEFELDESLQPEPFEPVATVVHGGGNNEAPSWLAATLDKMGDAIKAMAERPAPVAPTPPDPMAMIEKLASTMRSLTPAPPPAPPAPAPAPSFKDQLETIKSVIEVGTSIVDARGGGDGGGSGDAYAGIVERLATPVIDLMKTQAQREQLRRPPRQPALPAPKPTGPVPDQPAAPVPATGGAQMPWLLEIQKWMPLIVKRQQKQISAESTAYFVLDELSEPTLESLAQFFATDTAEANIQMILPAELRNDPTWTGEFLQAMRDYLFSDDEEEDEQPEQPTKTFDLQEEAERRLAKLRDNPEKTPEQAPEQ